MTLEEYKDSDQYNADQANFQRQNKYLRKMIIDDWEKKHKQGRKLLDKFFNDDEFYLEEDPNNMGTYLIKKFDKSILND